MSNVGWFSRSLFRSFEATLKERVTQGGASGAFFFFSKNETLIAKSCSLEELTSLRTYAKKYADYMEENPESYIGKVGVALSRIPLFPLPSFLYSLFPFTYSSYFLFPQILGIYQLLYHGLTISFFVMNNLFYNPLGISIHEKYDIKGSWVSRSAVYPSEGESATCANCEQKFIYHRKKLKKKNPRMINPLGKL